MKADVISETRGFVVVNDGTNTDRVVDAIIRRFDNEQVEIDVEEDDLNFSITLPAGTMSKLRSTK
jgi:hypothetical protein